MTAHPLITYIYRKYKQKEKDRYYASSTLPTPNNYPSFHKGVWAGMPPPGNSQYTPDALSLRIYDQAALGVGVELGQGLG
jgi:hypothetical protein